MKRICFFLVALIVLSMVLPVLGDGTIREELKDGTIVVCYSDGSKTVYSPAQLISRTDPDHGKASGSVTKSKPVTHYDSNGSIAWRFTLTATFTYNGTTAFCTNASYSNTIYINTWTFSNGSASRSGNAATGSGTYTKRVSGITVQTIPVSISLVCDENGNVN